MLTRFIAICPTLAIAIFYDINNLSGMNDLLNALMSLMLPFALIPCLIMSTSEKVMHEFKNGPITITVVSLLSVAVIGINLYFVYDYVSTSLPQEWWIFLIVALFFFYYITFVLYLIGCFLYIIGFQKIAYVPYIGVYFVEPPSMTTANLLNG